MTVHKGREASALAAAFNVLSLPAVVYQPPNCIAAVIDQCRCRLRLGTGCCRAIFCTGAAPLQTAPMRLPIRLCCK